MPRPCSDDWPVLAFAWDFGSVTPVGVTSSVMFSYDDIYSLEYFGTCGDYPRLHNQEINSFHIGNTRMEISQTFCLLLTINSLNYWRTVKSLTPKRSSRSCRLVGPNMPLWEH